MSNIYKGIGDGAGNCFIAVFLCGGRFVCILQTDQNSEKKRFGITVIPNQNRKTLCRTRSNHEQKVTAQK